MGRVGFGAGFGVDTGALPGLADLVDRRRQDLVDGRGYLRYGTAIPAGREGILGWLCGRHEAIVTGVDRFLATAADGCAGPYARSIARAAAYYRRTDAREAARFDATVAPVDDPGKHSAQVTGPAGPPARPGPADPFADRVCPADRYLPVADHQPGRGYAFAAYGLLTPTSAVRDAIWRLTRTAVAMGLLDRPYDVLEEVVDQFAGDWTAFANCADAYRHLADALADASGCVLDGVAAMPRVWTGNCADRCALVLARFASDLTRGAEVLRTTGDRYAVAAVQVRVHADALADLVSTLIDRAVEAPLALSGVSPFAGPQAALAVADAARLAVRARREASEAWEVARQFATAGQADALRLGVVRDAEPMPRLAAGLPDLPQPP